VHSYQKFQVIVIYIKFTFKQPILTYTVGENTLRRP